MTDPSTPRPTFRGDSLTRARHENRQWADPACAPVSPPAIAISNWTPSGHWSVTPYPGNHSFTPAGPEWTPGIAPLPERQTAVSKGTPIRIVLVDDHLLVREGIRSVLMMHGGLEVVAEANDGQEAIDLVDANTPDIVLMDVNMPRMNGIEATRAITARNPSVKVIALTVHDDETLAQAMYDAGAVAFMTKGARSDVLVALIRATLGR